MAGEAAPSYWGLVPAAGGGKRMGAGIPKQYLPLAGQPMLQHTLQRMLGWGFLEKILVALPASDEHWRRLPAASDERVLAITGGEERCDSVLAGLDALSGMAESRDWVLVHDAVRPCVTAESVDRLRGELRGDELGGLLALPITETVKRGDDVGRAQETVDRTGLWLAQTPQMFRYEVLRAALRDAILARQPVTDEAAAIELAGLHPLLVPGDPFNIKITRPQDLALAEAQLRQGVS